MTKTPSFCFITPISYLSFAQISQTHLVLAHLVDESPEYAEFYANLSDHGNFIMMDNSAYELKVPYSPEKLIELGKKCKAHAIVLPDYPFQAGQVTIDAAQQFIPQFLDAQVKTFFVPQSETGRMEDWIDAYTWAAYNPDIDIIGMSILGIPNALPWCDPSYARVVMTRILIDRGVFNFKKHHHYLGLNSGPALEIPSLIRLNALNTIDSSGPVWAGILGHEYTKNADSYQTVKKIKLPVDFHIAKSKDPATIERIFTNVRLTQELMDGGANAVWYANE